MDAKCERTCDGKCEVLEDLLGQEKEALHRYEMIIDTCDYPDVRTFLVELLGVRESVQKRIAAKIEELKIQAGTAHDVIDSFESFS